MQRVHEAPDRQIASLLGIQLGVLSSLADQLGVALRQGSKRPYPALECWLDTCTELLDRWRTSETSPSSLQTLG